MQPINNFTGLVERLTRRLTQPLPGSNAHEVMRAVPSGSLLPKFEHSLPPKPGSVLILLYPVDNKVHFPLTLRVDYPGAHGGQVSFPGGKAEPGETNIETALRECEEEIGVKRQTVNVIGRLSDFFVIPSNFMVTPIVAFSAAKPVFRPDPKEVVRILEGDLGALIEDEAIKKKEILAAKKFHMMAPYFDIDGEVVWGATAMMLNEMRTVLREITSA